VNKQFPDTCEYENQSGNDSGIVFQYMPVTETEAMPHKPYPHSHTGYRGYIIKYTQREHYRCTMGASHQEKSPYFQAG
jgi:hypothetical protein